MPHKVTFTPGVALVLSGNVSAYGDALTYGLLDVVAHEMAHLDPPNDALAWYLAEMPVIDENGNVGTLWMNTTMPGTEGHANAWMKEMREYYKSAAASARRSAVGENDQ